MNRFDAQLSASLSDEQLNHARHGTHPTLSPLLNGFTARAEASRRIVVALGAQPEDELNTTLWNEIDDMVGQFAAICDGLASLDEALPNVVSQAESLLSRYPSVENRLRDLRVHARDVAIDAANRTRELDQIRERQLVALQAAEMTAGKAQESLERVERLAGAVGAGRLERFYDSAAMRYRRIAGWWLLSGVASALLLAVAAWVVFGGIAVTEDMPWQELARDFVVRVTLLAALGYAVSVSIKSYRANTHLAVVAEQKKIALETFLLFLDSPANSEMVTAELVRYVFSPTDSGFIDTTTERTIIEQASTFMPTGLLRGPTTGG